VRLHAPRNWPKTRLLPGCDCGLLCTEPLTRSSAPMRSSRQIAEGGNHAWAMRLHG